MNILIILESDRELDEWLFLSPECRQGCVVRALRCLWLHEKRRS